MLEIGIAALIFVGIVITILLYTGKLRRFKFGVGLKGVEGEVETAQSQPPQLQTPQSASSTTQIVNNVGLNEEGIKNELEKIKNEILDSLKPGKTKNQDEINILKQELSGVEAKLANTKQALKERNAAFAEFEKSLESEKIKNAVSEDQLVLAHDKLKAGDSSQAEALFATILQEAETKTEAGAEAAFQLAKLADERIDYREALQLFEKAVQLAPENSLYLNEAGSMLDTLAHYDKAIEYYELALASDLKTYGPDHPEVAILRNNLGLAWNSKGEYDKAIEYYELALASDLKAYGSDHPRVATRWNNMGSTCHSKGEYDKAIKYYEKALASILKTFGPDYSDVATSYNNLGESWREKGEYDKAIEYNVKALNSDLKTFGPDHPRLATCWSNMGAIWHSKGEYDKAVEYYEKALAIDLKTFGSDHPDVAIDWSNLGSAWDLKGEYDKAIKYYEKASQGFEKAGLQHRVDFVKNNIDELKKKAGRE